MRFAQQRSKPSLQSEKSAATLSIGNPHSKTGPSVTLGAAEKAAITAESATEVGDEQAYTVLITELDMESGNCKVVFHASQMSDMREKSRTRQFARQTMDMR